LDVVIVVFIYTFVTREPITYRELRKCLFYYYKPF